jgi:hypothetical protein
MDHVIPDIGYDPALDIRTFGPRAQSVNANSLSALSNNFLAKAGNSSEAQVILIDETAVARVIAFNSNWVAYLNGKNDAVLSDIAPGSRVEQIVNAYHDGSYLIVFHRLSIGEIYNSGSTIYVLAQPHYTIVQEGKTAIKNDVILYKLNKSGNTLVISDMEAIPLGTKQATGSSP